MLGSIKIAHPLYHLPIQPHHATEDQEAVTHKGKVQVHIQSLVALPYSLFIPLLQ